jgi:hypothetical protein
MATGMGLHTAEIYHSLAVDVSEQQKRLFFSLYMMDRYVYFGGASKPKANLFQVWFLWLWVDPLLYKMMT